MKTPQMPAPKLAEALGLTNEVWLKREDEHHFGSHKGRSLPLMIAEHHRAGAREFVISSSGNAALAAARAVRSHNKNKPADPVSLQIFIGPGIAPHKQELVVAEGNPAITIVQVNNPKQTAQQFATTKKAVLLRQSTEPLALLGYHELAEELAKIGNLAAVFVPTSSGTTAQGLAESFAKLNLNPQIHIVQTTACHPIVEYIMAQSTEKQGDRHVAPLLAMTEKSLADA
ncbi:MAG: PLP-dependent lyase/thiolase, partial [Candidatus Magasanikbacteria bacterium]|nr:PLP-dependent lyase/thiolase [Candidatus Magasanikbacteria bacterium]